MKITYDQAFNALYIELRPLEPGTAETKQLSDDIFVEPKDRRIEILNAFSACLTKICKGR